MRHPHADLIHAWAEGATIEYRTKLHRPWTPTLVPTWDSGWEYRIKPKEPDWYKNIPEDGVLCWVSDNRSNPSSDNALRIITTRKSDCFEDPFGTEWVYATPLTDDEIRIFLRGEK
jgi:hypothetical protein